MAENLADYLKEHNCKGFSPVPQYVRSGDCLTFFFRNDRCYERRVDELLTIYLKVGTRELVGCKIKGIKHLLNTAGDFGLVLDGGNVQLAIFFVIAALRSGNEEARGYYAQLGKNARSVTVNSQALETCQ